MSLFFFCFIYFTSAAFCDTDFKSSESKKTPYVGEPGTKKERTFIAIKPDGVQRGLVGEIIRRFEQKGFKLVGLKLEHPTKEKAAGHYDDLKTTKFFNGLVEYFSSGPIVAMVWEGENVITASRRMIGETKPQNAAPGTIRGDLCINVGRNVIHGSDSDKSAVREIAFWFKEEEVHDWNAASNSWIYE